MYTDFTFARFPMYDPSPPLALDAAPIREGRQEGDLSRWICGIQHELKIIICNTRSNVNGK